MSMHVTAEEIERYLRRQLGLAAEVAPSDHEIEIAEDMANALVRRVRRLVRAHDVAAVQCLVAEIKQA